MQHDPNRPEDVLEVDADEDGVGGDDAAAAQWARARDVLGTSRYLAKPVMTCLRCSRPPRKTSTFLKTGCVSFILRFGGGCGSVCGRQRPVRAASPNA